MRLAAVHALARLARLGEEEIPPVVRSAYKGERFEFGPHYIIPKPFDPRVLLHVAPAVAQAAMATGVAREKLEPEPYRRELEARILEIAEL
jgi:malate dehydrogenase (oxaloacetate-decarboxylating)(NADP+)